MWIWCFNEAYPENTFLEVYSFLEEQGDFMICYIEQITKELKKQDDAVTDFMKKNNGNFQEIPTSDPEYILNQFYKNLKSLKKDSADPYIIATAKENLLTVVTCEKKSSTRKEELLRGVPNPKIPNICELEDIPCLSMAEFWNASNARF